MTKFVRFTIKATNNGEPGIDELEVYGPDDESRNLALAANGARATSSGSLPGYRIHELAGVNDGRYGNGHCWIADRREDAWVQIELPQQARIQKIVWSRDREGKFVDRLATSYVIEAAAQPGKWIKLASSDDRKPPGTNMLSGGLSPVTLQFVNRFAPVSTALSSEAERSSPEYTVDSWQTPDGLPANTVTAIAQTSDGYLWLGTVNGLARFDGVRFKVFGPAEGLQNSRVLCLLVDRQGVLWAGTEGGLARWQQGAFTVLTTKDGLLHDTVLALTEDPAGRIWIGTAGGLSCWHDGRFERDKRLVPRTQGPFSRLVPDENRIWGTIQGYVLVIRDGRMERADIAGEPSWFSSMYALHRGPSGRVWFGGANNYVSCLSNGVVTVYPEQPGQLLDSIWELLEMRSGDVWVGTASAGLRRLRNGHFSSVTTQEGLSDNSVRSLFEDREGNLWVGTVGGGLNRIKPRRVTTFTTRDGLSHNVIMSLAEDKEGAIWIGSNCGGLNVRRNGRLAAFTAHRLLDNECIWSLLAAGDGSLWIGTWTGGLFQKQDNEIAAFPLAGRDNDQPIVALCEAAHGGIWLGTYSAGLKLWQNGAKLQFTTSNGLSANFVTAIVQDGSNTLWVGTGGGGLNQLQLDATGRSDARIQNVFRLREGLPNDFVRTLHLDQKGALWIGTDGGLARLSGRHLTAFTRAQGLPDEVISQILDDDHENLWLGSNQGIFCVAKAELDKISASRAGRLNMVVYSRADGMESAQCTGGFHPAGLRTGDGKLWFSTVKGLVMIDPGRISRNERAPAVLIEQVSVDGNVVSAGDGLLNLSHRIGRLEFQFTATSLTAPERNRFRHKLEGLDRDWIEDGTQRVAAYHHLPPGSYRFHIAGCNADSVWNEAGAIVPLRILPPFWQTWWFRALAGCVVLGGSGSAVRYWSERRLRYKLQELQQQHALDNERARIAEDIHDELGATLTSIALLTELGQKHRERPEEVTADLNKISATARDAVRAMDAIVWAVNPRNDSLDHFANYVSQFAEEFFRLTPIRCRLDIPADLPERRLSTEVRHHLFLAVKESLNNVVRHSGASEVWLRVSCNNGELAVVIDDNGRGIADADRGPGHDGLANIRNRLETLGGQFCLDAKSGKGTTVRMVLPLPSGEAANRPKSSA